MRIKGVAMEEDQRLPSSSAIVLQGQPEGRRSRRSHNDYRRAGAVMSPRSVPLARSRFLHSSVGARCCLCSEVKLAHPPTCERVILTGRLVLVPRRTIRHL